MERVYDARLAIGNRKKLVFLLSAVAILSSWIYWNRPKKDDMAAYAPADSVAFIEANDLPAIIRGIEEIEAWRVFAGPLNAPEHLLPHRWLIWLARWTGIGSIDTLLVARSQVALAFTQAQALEDNNTLTVKPLAAVIIQTHTTQRRMRPALERHVEQFARRAYGQPNLIRKQIDAVDLTEWSSADTKRQIILAFVDTIAVIGNEESVVLQCVDVRRGKRQSLSDNKQLQKARQQLGSMAGPLFGFIPTAGVKPLIQAWALSRAGSSPDGATGAQLISSTFGNLIESFAWTARFDSAGAEDRCFVALAEGVGEKLGSSLTPDPLGARNEFSFVPPEATSVASYQLGNPESFWQDLNAVVSSHSDVLGAVVARPFLRAQLKSYGIENPEVFVGAIGTHLQTIRLENNEPAVLVTEAVDRPSLNKLVQQRLSTGVKNETIGDAVLMLSTTDNWAAAFDGNHFLTGPADSVRRCLNARANSNSVATVGSFRRAQSLVDISLPIIALTFANDKQSAISFVELFSDHERSAFSANAAAIQQASQSLPFSVSVTMMKDGGFEWTSRSSFGLLGALFTRFAPEKSH